MKAKLIIGFDEVGRGPLAGPVVVGCVLVDEETAIPDDIVIRDSKKMSVKQKEKANEWIRKNFNFGIGEVSAFEIDQKGINNAVRLAAFKALKNLEDKTEIDFPQTELLIDGQDAWIKGSKAIIKGDDKITAISMASIVAKVYRDNLMIKLAQNYPGWGFEKHVGYGTKMHCQKIREFGLIKNIHRMSFCKKLVVKS